jgi:hypothetical protein
MFICFANGNATVFTVFNVFLKCCLSPPPPPPKGVVVIVFEHKEQKKKPLTYVQSREQDNV